MSGRKAPRYPLPLLALFREGRRPSITRAALGAGVLLAGACAAQAPSSPGGLPPPDRPGRLKAEHVQPHPPEPTPALKIQNEPPRIAVTPRPTTRTKPVRQRNAAWTNGLYTVAKAGRGVYYRRGFVLNVGINVIEADLNDPEVRVGAMVARGGIGTAERFGDMVRRARPAAAITGTFFGTRSLEPTGDLIIDGQEVFRGFVGTAVAITEGNIVSFVPTRYKDTSVDWSLFHTVIRGGPRLVEKGRVNMAVRNEGFRTLTISRRRTRTAVGLTRDNRIQFVAVRQGITLWELAKVMRHIGAYHAVALDGGSSTAMYFSGRYVARPARGLTNVLMIYHRRDHYEAMRHQFAAHF